MTGLSIKDFMTKYLSHLIAVLFCCEVSAPASQLPDSSKIVLEAYDREAAAAKGKAARSGDASGDPLKWTNSDEVKEGAVSLGIYANDEVGKRTLLTSLPPGTLTKSFLFRFEKVCLRTVDSQASDNARHVVYDIQ